MFVQIIGYLATIVGSSMMMPQAIKSWRTRKVDDLSVTAIVLYCLNCLLWLTYGVFSSPTLPPVILANVIGLTVGVFQFFIKIAYAPRPKGVKNATY